MLNLVLKASNVEKTQYSAILWKYSKNPSKQFDKSWLTIPGCYLQKTNQFLLKLRYFCVTWCYLNFITFECSYGVFEARKWPDFICYAQFWHLILNWYSIHMTCPNVVETFDWSMSYGCLFIRWFCIVQSPVRIIRHVKNLNEIVMVSHCKMIREVF